MAGNGRRRLVKTGSPALRKAGMILAALALALPVAADIVWRFRMRG
jgi:hypothetical protein